MRIGLLVTVLALSPNVASAQQPTSSKLKLEHVGSDSTAFNVIATMVIGPSEVLLWDAHYHVNDARRVADRIAASGRKLIAIVLSHADHDHFSAAAAIVERFPGTPVYMTAAALDEYQERAKQSFTGEKARRPELFPDSLVSPQVLPSLQLTVDGEVVQIIPDLTGDVIVPTNSVAWIPSLRAALAGDIVFDHVHAWFGSSDAASRARWRQSLTRIADLKPAIVVAGHKKDVNAPDSPEVLDRMAAYLEDFEQFRKSSASADELFAKMQAKYPDHVVRGLLRHASRYVFQKSSAQ